VLHYIRGAEKKRLCPEDLLDSHMGYLCGRQACNGLVGPVPQYRAVAYNCRVVFRFSDAQRVVLLDIGTHDEVY
jgi:hypothetical protein